MNEPWEKLEAKMRAMRPEPLSPGLEQRILARLAAPPAAPRRRAPRAMAWALAAVACALVLGISLWVANRKQTPAGPGGAELATTPAPKAPNVNPVQPGAPSGAGKTAPREESVAGGNKGAVAPRDAGKPPAEPPRVAERLPAPAPRDIPPPLPQPPAAEDQVSPKPDCEQIAKDKPATVRPAAVQLEMAPGETPDQAWEKYFAAHEPEPAAVRDAARRLMNEQKFDHVIALIEAALRNRQAQPWMYEALALAMEAAGRPKKDVERALMSAVEFCSNTADLMYLGVYLTQLGLDRRAIGIFHEVAQLEPVWAEPYMHAMKAAQRINDLDGLQWSTVGILGQGWTANQSEVWQTALRVAKATLEDLRAKKRNKEAAAFEAALDAALVRDCVVNVYWTGDAEIDLLVEEPTGVVCSLRNYRTTAGGVLCGDTGGAGKGPAAADSGLGGANKGIAAPGHCQTYLCPKGFSGLYRVLVRRVWGEVVTGSAIVEIVTHYHTPREFCVRKKIPLDKGEALVNFELAGGRRKEELRDAQVANAAIGQLAVGRQILAQQIAALADPAAEAALAAARQKNGNNNNNGVVPVPLFPAPAVGYQPVIITLPEGANLAATAVVSADRRYVRITTVPLFSGVTSVHTFNYTTGAGGTQSYNNNSGGSGIF